MIENELKELIYSEMRQKERLTEKWLPSIGSINLLNSNRQVNCTTLSQSGNLLAVGMSDSTVRVFWLDRGSLVRSLGMGDSNPFTASEKEHSHLIN